MPPKTLPSITIIVPALNEEAHVADAVAEVKKVVEGRFSDYEILLIDDGSTDRTGEIMDALAKADPKIRVFHHASPRNLGGAYKQGLLNARMEYVLMVPGDNENPSDALFGPLDALGSADVIIPYPKNPEVRAWSRRFASRSYVNVLNRAFGLNVRYFNGTVIHRVDCLKEIAISTNSFAYQSEALIKLLRRGKSYVEVGVDISPPEDGQTAIWRWKNVKGVARSVVDLLIEIHLRDSMSGEVGATGVRIRRRLIRRALSGWLRSRGGEIYLAFLPIDEEVPDSLALFAEELWTYAPARIALGTTAMLGFVELAAPSWIMGKPTPFSKLDPEEQQALIEKMGSSGFYLVRLGHSALRSQALVAACRDPKVRKDFGLDEPSQAARAKRPKMKSA